MNYDAKLLNTPLFVSLSCLIATIGLTGCTSMFDPGADAFLTPARPIIEKQAAPDLQHAPSKATFLSTQSPDVQKAYQLYEKTGKAPIIQTQEFLQFPFGETQPTINCQPIRTCDIALQSGEKVTGVFPGDTARWKYQIASSGEGANRQPHVIFKPTDYNIATNVVITTTRRTYYLGLVSDQNNYVRQVKFWYPDDMQAQWNQIAQSIQEENEKNNQTTVAQLPNVNLADLNFHYHVSKPLLQADLAWMPKEGTIFNDGTHVYIPMPHAMQSTDAPALFVLTNDGQKALVNYRVKNNYYIVDELFKQAVLLTGVGGNQQRVTITYNG